ncbi:MAG: hypothetical protein H6706_23445 [Myxococcales bacterium]|nr:hypothetical protein [Myxococcales bacterium]
MRRFLCLSALLLPLAACDEEAKPDPVAPEVTRALVECRPVDGIYTLSVIDFTVLDLDGADDLEDDPIVLVEATRIPMEREVLAWDASRTEKCRAEACEVRYRWEYQRGETDQIFCGEADALVLSARVDVQDKRGLVSRKLVNATPL